VPYSQEELEAAVEALVDSDRFRAAEELVSAAAPGLQRVLTEALAAGGWFDDSHQGQLLKAATTPDSDERLLALKTLLADETRISMMIGVAVGWTLAEELREGTGENRTHPPDEEE
jgi:hypothetical protein